MRGDMQRYLPKGQEEPEVLLERNRPQSRAYDTPEASAVSDEAVRHDLPKFQQAPFRRPLRNWDSAAQANDAVRLGVAVRFAWLRVRIPRHLVTQPTIIWTLAPD